MIIGKSDIDGFGVFFFFSAQHHQNMYNAQPLYLDQNKFYITTLFESQQFVHHHFIWITTSFTSPLYFDHNKFYIATLFESQHQGLPHYFNHNDCYITMFIAVLHHYFILTRTSFTSPLYFDHNKFHITTLFGPQQVLHRHFSQQVLPHSLLY